jgi:hypothetical protein
MGVSGEVDEVSSPHLLDYQQHLKKVNGVDAVFLQEPYSMYQHLPAKGEDYDLNVCYCGSGIPE